MIILSMFLRNIIVELLTLFVNLYQHIYIENFLFFKNGAKMSCNNFESGTIFIPSHSWSKFKKSMQEAQNKERDRIFKLAVDKQADIEEHFKGKKNVEFWEVINYTMNTMEMEDYMVTDIISLSLKKEGCKMYKITQKMMDKVIDKANSKTVCFGGNMDCGLTVNNEARSVEWEVCEGNRACELARNSWLGKAVFNNLSKIEYGNSKKFGGVILGNNEINYEEGDGTQYITARFGKIGEIFSIR